MVFFKYFMAIFIPIIIGALGGFYYSNFIFNYKRLFASILLSLILVIIAFSVSNILGIELLIASYFYNYVSFKTLNQKSPNNHIKGYPIQIDPEKFKHERDTEGIPKELLEMREKNYCHLAEYGFRCARWLPIDTDKKLRSPLEIASRLYALNTLVMWVTLPEDFFSTEDMLKLIEKQKPHPWLTPDELEILSFPRKEANEQNIDSIGWRFENMWVLAWILGFDIKPLFYVGQIPEDISTQMLLTFIPENKNPENILEKNTLRSESEIIEMEDLFYCAHNAVRSAQMGSNSVPSGFHPIIDGGAIHERRHALTWCLSPDVSWDETDLST
ncbi:MAG: DUF4272 domain-containing protein [Cyanobacteriota bacterium]